MVASRIWSWSVHVWALKETLPPDLRQCLHEAGSVLETSVPFHRPGYNRRLVGVCEGRLAQHHSVVWSPHKGAARWYLCSGQPCWCTPCPTLSNVASRRVGDVTTCFSWQLLFRYESLSYKLSLRGHIYFNMTLYEFALDQFLKENLGLKDVCRKALKEVEETCAVPTGTEKVSLWS